MFQEATDARLIKEFQAGQEAAFEHLLKKYLSSVYNFVYQLVGDQASAEDVAQETFIKAWKNLKKFDQQKSFKTWLFIIAKNTAFDYLKKKKSIPFSFFEDEEGKNPILEEIKDDQILPDEILQREDVAKLLEEKLGQLSKSYQLILTLHYKEDLSLEEISQVLQVPYNTIKSQHTRALAKLREAFSQG